jgi:hypothetical protein
MFARDQITINEKPRTVINIEYVGGFSEDKKLTPKDQITVPILLVITDSIEINGVVLRNSISDLRVVISFWFAIFSVIFKL